MAVYRQLLNEYKSRPDPGEEFDIGLSKAVIDDYERKCKASRNYPRKKKHNATGPPNIVQATKEQRQKAAQFKGDSYVAQQEGLAA